MCGIAGLFRFTGDTEQLSRIVTEMTDSLVHRGPDANEIWVDAKRGVGLGHRRLSILDLSPTGAQPMHSSSQRFVLTFNGEIYNHQDLRAALPKQFWRGHSDTETILAAIDCWGIKATLPRLIGMFAIALWDRERHELTLARDRCGEKPLYYGWHSGCVLFASELKAFGAHSGWRPEVDRNALALYLRFGYVPMPHCIWRDVCKLLPGSYLTLSTKCETNNLPAPTLYWRAGEIATKLPRNDLDDLEAVNQLDTMLRRVVAGQMIADVPLGAFLSGGVDSSVIVALMQVQSASSVQTFSIGFSEADYNEAVYAKAVAQHLGTSHTELYLTPSDALAVIPKLPDIFDEPFGDSSQIPTYLVATIARRHVKSCLSGDGGDELFGGYNRYVLGRSIWHRMEILPRGFRQLVARVIKGVSPQILDLLGQHLPKSLQQPALGDRLHKLAEVIDAVSSDAFYQRLIYQHRDEESIVIGGNESPIWAEVEMTRFVATAGGTDFSERMMFHDLVGYLSDDILTKVDRAGMAASLETRIPMLDHRLVEFAWSLPLHMKIRHGKGKWLLRQVLYRYVPRELIERPKQGFGIPLDGWLRGPLRDWAESLLDESRLRREGYLKPELIRQRWNEHLSGRRNWQHWLWNVLMFQAWQERWV